MFHSNILQCVLHCECILGHWLVRKQLNDIDLFPVMWEQDNIRSTAGPRSSSVSMKTFSYTSPTLIFDSHKVTEIIVHCHIVSLLVTLLHPCGFRLLSFTFSS